VQAGDVVLHNILVLHGSLPGHAESPLRRTVYFEYRSIEQEMRVGPHRPGYVGLKQRPSPPPPKPSLPQRSFTAASAPAARCPTPPSLVTRPTATSRSRRMPRRRSTRARSPASAIPTKTTFETITRDSLLPNLVLLGVFGVRPLLEGVLGGEK